MKVILFLLVLSGVAQGATFKKSKMILCSVTMNVEVADDDDKREQGLMNRKTLGDDEGMIFVFDKAEPQGFWMKNTLVPLSIGFFDAKGNLFQIIDMDPASSIDLDPKIYKSSKSAKFALEEPQGWFKRKKIVENGCQLKLPAIHLP
jgi:uncharacterized membrane protein (UPF0127 family)